MSIPEVWKGDRNPVKYGTMEDLGIDPSTLEWKPMPEVGELPTAAPAPQKTVAPLTMAEAKKGLAMTFGVAPEAIEITIRG